MSAALNFLCIVSVWSLVLSDIHVGGTDILSANYQIPAPETVAQREIRIDSPRFVKLNFPWSYSSAARDCVDNCVGTELAVPDTRLKYVHSTVTGSCQCGGTSCQCCQTIHVLGEKKDICIKVQYLKKNIGVLLTVTWGGKVVYSKEVSARNPPAICLNVPFLKKAGKLCVQLYNMDVGKSDLSGCARVSLKVAFVKVVKVELGCFKIPLAEDEIMEVTGVGTELVVPDTRLKYVHSTVTGSCQCGGTSCQCCQTIHVLGEKKDVCIKVQYLKKNIGVLLTVTWGGKVVYSKEVSARNPPAICLNVPFLKKAGKLCVQLYNMDIGKSDLSGCASVSLKVAFVKVVKVELGCFKIPLAEDEIMEVTGSSKMEALLRYREREMKLFADFLKHLFRKDQ